MTPPRPRPLTETFSAWLAKAMRAAGLEIDRQRGGGRKDLAEAIGVSNSTVARWLDGHTLPGVEYLDRIARALNVRPIDMLVESGILESAE